MKVISGPLDVNLKFCDRSDSSSESAEPYKVTHSPLDGRCDRQTAALKREECQHSGKDEESTIYMDPDCPIPVLSISAKVFIVQFDYGERFNLAVGSSSLSSHLGDGFRGNGDNENPFDREAESNAKSNVEPNTDFNNLSKSAAIIKTVVASCSKLEHKNGNHLDENASQTGPNSVITTKKSARSTLHISTSSWTRTRAVESIEPEDHNKSPKFFFVISDNPERTINQTDVCSSSDMHHSRSCRKRPSTTSTIEQAEKQTTTTSGGTSSSDAPYVMEENHNLDELGRVLSVYQIFDPDAFSKVGITTTKEDVCNGERIFELARTFRSKISLMWRELRMEERKKIVNGRKRRTTSSPVAFLRTWRGLCKKGWNLDISDVSISSEMLANEVQCDEITVSSISFLTKVEFELFLRALRAALQTSMCSTNKTKKMDSLKSVSSSNSQAPLELNSLTKDAVNVPELILIARRVSKRKSSCPAYVLLDKNGNAIENNIKRRAKDVTGGLSTSSKRKRLKKDESYSQHLSSMLDESVSQKAVCGPAPNDIEDEVDYSFFFVTPEENVTLTNYMFLLFAQVKRGVLTQLDLGKGNRKKIVEVGYLGLRCRHCGGKEKGNYFPSSCKNLQACPQMIHTHLMKCVFCPTSVKIALKRTKSKHRGQMMTMAPGTQIAFFLRLWTRIHDANYDGGGTEMEQIVRGMMSSIVDEFSVVGKAHSDCFQNENNLSAQPAGSVQKGANNNFDPSQKIPTVTAVVMDEIVKGRSRGDAGDDQSSKRGVNEKPNSCDDLVVTKDGPMLEGVNVGSKHDNEKDRGNYNYIEGKYSEASPLVEDVQNSSTFCDSEKAQSKHLQEQLDDTETTGIHNVMPTHKASKHTYHCEIASIPSQIQGILPTTMIPTAVEPLPHEMELDLDLDMVLEILQEEENEATNTSANKLRLDNNSIDLDYSFSIEPTPLVQLSGNLNSAEYPEDMVRAAGDLLAVVQPKVPTENNVKDKDATENYNIFCRDIHPMISSQTNENHNVKKAEPESGEQLPVSVSSCKQKVQRREKENSAASRIENKQSQKSDCPRRSDNCVHEFNETVENPVSISYEIQLPATPSAGKLDADEKIAPQLSSTTTGPTSIRARRNCSKIFTNEDDVLLVKGILKHGKKWKQIWDDFDGLKHIKQSSLKDRARSQRFKHLLDRVRLDVRILDNPSALYDFRINDSYEEDEDDEETDAISCSSPSLGDHPGLKMDTPTSNMIDFFFLHFASPPSPEDIGMGFHSKSTKQDEKGGRGEQQDQQQEQGERSFVFSAKAISSASSPQNAVSDQIASCTYCTPTSSDLCVNRNTGSINETAAFECSAPSRLSVPKPFEDAPMESNCGNNNHGDSDQQDSKGAALLSFQAAPSLPMQTCALSSTAGDNDSMIPLCDTSPQKKTRKAGAGNNTRITGNGDTFLGQLAPLQLPLPPPRKRQTLTSSAGKPVAKGLRGNNDECEGVKSEERFTTAATVAAFEFVNPEVIRQTQGKMKGIDMNEEPTEVTDQKHETEHHVIRSHFKERHNKNHHFSYDPDHNQMHCDKAQHSPPHSSPNDEHNQNSFKEEKEGCLLGSDLSPHHVLSYNSDEKTSSSYAVIRKEKPSSSSLTKKRLQFHGTVEDETVPSKNVIVVHKTDPDEMPIGSLTKKKSNFDDDNILKHRTDIASKKVVDVNLNEVSLKNPTPPPLPLSPLSSSQLLQTNEYVENKSGERKILLCKNETSMTSQRSYRALSIHLHSEDATPSSSKHRFFSPKTNAQGNNPRMKQRCHCSITPTHSSNVKNNAIYELQNAQSRAKRKKDDTDSNFTRTHVCKDGTTSGHCKKKSQHAKKTEQHNTVSNGSKEQYEYDANTALIESHENIGKETDRTVTKQAGQYLLDCKKVEDELKGGSTAPILSDNDKHEDKGKCNGNVRLTKQKYNGNKLLPKIDNFYFIE